MKTFHLGDILTITTGHLVANEGISAVYRILDYMTGDSVFTHQLPRVRHECRPYLIQQYPWLETIHADEVNTDNWQAWLAEQVETHGAWHEVSTIPRDDHTVRDPLDELRQMRPDVTIIPVKIDQDEDDYQP